MRGHKYMIAQNYKSTWAQAHEGTSTKVHKYIKTTQFIPPLWCYQVCQPSTVCRVGGLTELAVGGTAGGATRVVRERGAQ